MHLRQTSIFGFRTHSLLHQWRRFWSQLLAQVPMRMHAFVTMQPMHCVNKNVHLKHHVNASVEDTQSRATNSLFDHIEMCGA